jgi:hypothetical protein
MAAKQLSSFALSAAAASLSGPLPRKGMASAPTAAAPRNTPLFNFRRWRAHAQR